MDAPALPPDLDALLRTAPLPDVLAAILAHFDCPVGTVHLLGSDGALHLAAHRGLPPPLVGIVAQVPVGKGIAGLAAERRAPVTICNLQTDTTGQARPGARATGMEGSLAVPMLTPAGDLRGVLGIAKPTAHDWTPEETTRLLAMAARLAERELPL